jgi:hypothetical protein
VGGVCVVADAGATFAVWGKRPRKETMSFDWNNPDDLDSLIVPDVVEKIDALPADKRAEIMAILDKLK